MSVTNLPRPVIIFGLAGVGPQILCVVGAAMTSAPFHGYAVSIGAAYAASIVSFLGGLWWMAGVLHGLRDVRIYLASVSYSLLGWAALLPMCLGSHSQTGPLVGLGALLLVSPLVDHALASRVTLPNGWQRLRVMMAGGLGSLTLLLAAVA